MTVKNSIYLFLFGALLIFSGRVIYDLKAGDKHPANLACDNCHLARENIDAGNANILVASQEVLCSSCHENALTASHPSGFTPSMPIPKTFPLDWKAELTCSTCHSVHGNKPGLMRVARRGKNLCLSCHEEKFFSTMKDGGTSVMSFGHLDARDSSGGDIDSFTIQCMSCHETLEGDLNVQIRGGITRHSNSKASHPVGMNYEQSAIYGGYRPISSLPAEIALPNGTMSCISCHQGYSDEHGQLVISNDRSALCFSCHDL